MPRLFTFIVGLSLLGFAFHAGYADPHDLSAQDLSHQDAPVHKEYRDLEQAVQKLRLQLAEQGEWPMIPPQKTKLAMGDQSLAITALRARLQSGGYLKEPSDQPDDYFDSTLAQAVQAFQQQHGLEPDGVVGKQTLAALNVSLAQRIEQIELNMQRWRTLPHDLGARHIRVNIAGFELTLLDHNKVILQSRVVVGMRYRQTPNFSSDIHHLIFHPTWDVPHKLAVEDKLPMIQEDPDFFVKNKFQLYERVDGRLQRINPNSIDWSEVSSHGFPFHLRQLPGERNALGQVKFIFPNEFNVYLHDTPSRSLFSRSSRTYSSGCIRVERALELAYEILQHDKGWSHEQIDEIIDMQKQRTVPLQEPIPVHILYLTAWVDAQGVIQFREDIYGRDRALAKTLTKQPLEK